MLKCQPIAGMMKSHSVAVIDNKYKTKKSKTAMTALSTL